MGDHTAHVDLCSGSGGADVYVLIEDEVVNDVAEPKCTLYGPIGKAFFRSPDNLCSPLVTRAKSLFDHGLIQRSPGESWLLALHRSKQFQQFFRRLFRIATLTLR